jgi:DNA helicase IV
MTLVGDIAQATAPAAAANWTEIVKHFPAGLHESRMHELTLSYRIPASNLVLANQVLSVAAPELVAPTAVRTVGSEPRIIDAGHSGNFLSVVVRVIKEEAELIKGGSLAVIVSSSLIDLVDQTLENEGVDFGRATTASRNVSGPLHPKIALVPVHLVKGLEVDGSVVVEPRTIVEDEPQGLRALYVALTRSTKRLALVHERDLPEVLLPQKDI